MSFCFTTNSTHDNKKYTKISLFFGKITGFFYTQTVQATYKFLAGVLAFTTLLITSPFAFGQEALVVVPYEQTFIISAYYSPKPNQSVYFRGSFEADRRLNGNGTHGADGTPVYVGMLAGPKSYAFGTKLAIPGLGVGAVHDRGGAIVDAGVRRNKYDRIDVWMGEGEAGLARALTWGMRTVTATVYPPSYTIAEHFDLPTSLLATNSLKAASPAKSTTTVKTAAVIATANTRFPASLATGDSGERVRELQLALFRLGNCDHEANGVYDAATATCVTNFQMANGILKTTSDFGAGVFGDKTRAALATTIDGLDATLDAIIANKLPANTAAPGDTGDVVMRLQEGLATLGFFASEVNGNYDDTTRAAVVAFQINSKIIGGDGDYGAGFFGAKTKSAFIKKLRETLLTGPTVATNPTWNRPLTITYTPTFDTTLSVGDTGTKVGELQQTLTKLGFYAGEVNGTYDTATRAAVVAFQIDATVVQSADDEGAGTLGPKTRAALAAAIAREKIALTKTKNPA